jgi:cobalt-zinc-cadmium efflux system outer membrane protein
MLALRGEKPPIGIFLWSVIWLTVISICSVNASVAFSQDQSGEPVRSIPSQDEHVHEAVTPLRDLLNEAEQNNPQIMAARLGWESAKQIPSQVSTLPDPQFTVQQVNVGSPRPFAGYTNSDFAYFGLGVSQDFPYPGKLRLRGEMAKRDADVAQQQYESIRRSIAAEIKAAYFQLSYLSKTLEILESDGELLQQVEKAADARYRSGMGNQHDLLQAQLERTKLLREITMHHLEVAKMQAQIKHLLNRSQSSTDIEPADLSETPLSYTFDELLSTSKSDNSEISGAQKMVDKQSLQVDLAHEDFYPDFSLQYMWQRLLHAQFHCSRPDLSQSETASRTGSSGSRPWSVA